MVIIISIIYRASRIACSSKSRIRNVDRVDATICECLGTGEAMRMQVRMRGGWILRFRVTVDRMLPKNGLMTWTDPKGKKYKPYLRLLLSVTIHGTSSSLQFVHGAPCSTTLQRTFRALQHWQALEARLLTGRPFELTLRPAESALRFGDWGTWSDSGESWSGFMMTTGEIFAHARWSWEAAVQRDMFEAFDRWDVINYKQQKWGKHWINDL